MNQIKGLIGELISFETYLSLELIELMKSGTYLKKYQSLGLIGGKIAID
jgi:hypothetical protein